MLLIEERCPTQPTSDAVLALPFHLRQKTRLRTRLVGGEEVGLFLERGTILRGGDCLRARDGRIGGVDLEKSRLCRRLRLWADPHPHAGSRRRSESQSAAADR